METTARLFAARFLSLVDLLPEKRKQDLMRELLEKSEFRIYPSLLLIPNYSFSPEKKSRSPQLHRCSLEEKKYVPSTSRIPEGHKTLIPLGIDKYLILMSSGHVYECERELKRLVFENAKSLRRLPDGKYFSNLLDSQSTLLGPDFKTLGGWSEELDYLCSSEHFLVFSKWGKSLTVFDTVTLAQRGANMDKQITGGVVFGNSLIVATTLSPAYLLLIDIPQISAKEDVIGNAGVLLKKDQSLFLCCVSQNLILVHEQFSNFHTLFRIEDSKLMEVQEIKGSSPEQVCDGLVLFRDTQELWKLSNGMIYLFEVFGSEKWYFEFMYPSHKEMKEAGPPVPIEVVDILVGFCLERI